MHTAHKVFFAASLMVQCFCVHAEVSSSVTTTVSSPFQQETVPQFPASMQLPTNEVAVLLEHLQNQHVYLKHLENVRNAVERELSIVRLMSECGRLGSVCTGRGIEIISGSREFKDEKSDFSPRLAPSPLPSPLPVARPLPAAGLPELIAVYHGVASLFYERRYLEVRQGESLGPFTVRSVDVDGVKIDGPQGMFSLSPRWNAPRLVHSFSPAADPESAFPARHAR